MIEGRPPAGSCAVGNFRVRRGCLIFRKRRVRLTSAVWKTGRPCHIPRTAVWTAIRLGVLCPGGGEDDGTARADRGTRRWAHVISRKQRTGHTRVEHGRAFLYPRPATRTRSRDVTPGGKAIRCTSCQHCRQRHVERCAHIPTGVKATHQGHIPTDVNTTRSPRHPHAGWPISSPAIREKTTIWLPVAHIYGRSG